MSKAKHHAKKLVLGLIWTGFAAAFVAMVVTGYWLTYPYEVIRVNQPIEITNPNDTITVGERIQTSVTYTKYKPFTSTNFPQVVCKSGNLVQFASYTTNAPVGSGTFKSDNFILPPKFLDGDTCQLVVRQVYQVNPIRKVTYESRSEYFTVRELLEISATENLKQDLQ